MPPGAPARASSHRAARPPRAARAWLATRSIRPPREKKPFKVLALYRTHADIAADSGTCRTRPRPSSPSIADCGRPRSTPGNAAVKLGLPASGPRTRSHFAAILLGPAGPGGPMLFRQLRSIARAVHELYADSGFSMAGAVAYSFVLSLFPFCIFLGALAG